MKYVARTTAPNLNNSCYYSTKNALYRDGFGMPNCTCYALGRWIELLGYIPRLCLGMAGRWYGYNDGYQRGNTPKLGAIAVWGLNGSNIDGHVAVVEDFGDGYIYCSNSAYKSTNFYMKYYYGNYNFGSYIFKGFIYPPINFENEVAQATSIKKEIIGGNLYFIDLNWKKGKQYVTGTIVTQIEDTIYQKWGYNYVKVNVQGNIGYMCKDFLKDYVEPVKEEPKPIDKPKKEVPIEETPKEETPIVDIPKIDEIKPVEEEKEQDSINTPNDNETIKDEPKNSVIHNILDLLIKIFNIIFKKN